MAILAPLVVPAGEALAAGATAAWAWATTTTGLTVLGTTTAVVATAAVVKKVNENGDAEAATGDPDPCPTCKPKDKQRCDKLQKSIENKIKEIEQKRGPDLYQNRGNLPWDIPGAPPSQTIVGHLDLFNEMQGHLAKDMLEFVDKKCGPVPKGALAAVMREAPVPLLGQ